MAGMNFRRLAAVDMYGTRGAKRRRRIIRAELIAEAVVMVAFGVWLAACSGRAVGFCIIGCDLNYALPGGQARVPQVIRPPGERGGRHGRGKGQQPGALPGALLLSGRHPCEVSRAVLACTRRCWTSPRSFRPFSVRASFLSVMRT